jgi:uncharacterized membrane protein YdjX (TVP38/TMEM64 family)
MDFSFETLQEYLTEENIEHWLAQYRNLGPLPGILLPMLEAFLPILPLVIFVAGNAAAYGFWLGVLYSWLGTVLGSLVVFLIIRKLSHTRFLRYVANLKKIHSLLNWIEKQGFGPLFLVYCFPFTPSALINVVAGLSQIPLYVFAIAVGLGKLVMIFIISYIGYDFWDIIKHPLQMIVVGVVIFIMWLVGKFLERRMGKTGQKEFESSTSAGNDAKK